MSLQAPRRSGQTSRLGTHRQPIAADTAVSSRKEDEQLGDYKDADADQVGNLLDTYCLQMVTWQ